MTPAFQLPPLEWKAEQLRAWLAEPFKFTFASSPQTWWERKFILFAAAPPARKPATAQLYKTLDWLLH